MRRTDGVQENLLNESHARAGLDLRYGGQHGYAINIGGAGEGVEDWLNAAPYISRRIITVVLDTPKFFNYYENARVLKDYFINLLETGAEKVTGLKGGLTMNTDSFQISGDGAEFETFTKMVREQPSVTYTFREREGKPIGAFWDWFMRHGVNDPDAQRPMVTTLDSFVNATSDAEKLYGPSMWTSTVLHFEPSFSFLDITEAWFAVNHFPKSSGSYESQYDLTADGEMLAYDIEFTGIYRNNAAVRAFAKTILDGMKTMKQDPNEIAMFLTKRRPSTEGAAYSFNTPLED